MRPDDREKLAAYYDEKLKTYGDDPRSLGWTPGSRQLRFDVISAIGDLEGCRVLDVGCGFGDLYGYLRQKNINVDYFGVDINPDFTAVARGKYPGARFETADFEERGVDGSYDWAFAVGVFTIRLSDNKAFVRKMLQRMFDCSRKGFAADFLRPAYGNGEEDIYWSPQPEDIVKICRSLSKRIVLRCDYIASEYCIYVYKNDMADECNIFEEYAYRKYWPYR